MSGKHPEGYCPVFGNYPKEYNRKVHGPYYPWVNYGPKDIKFQDVKLGELKQYIARQNKTPQAIIAAISRGIHKWNHTWIQPRYGSPVKGFNQFMFILCTCSMLGSYSVYRNHRMHKYHW